MKNSTLTCGGVSRFLVIPGDYRTIRQLCKHRNMAGGLVEAMMLCFVVGGLSSGSDLLILHPGVSVTTTEGMLSCGLSSIKSLPTLIAAGV